MAEAQLIGCDGGNVYAFLVFDDLTGEVTGIRYANTGLQSCTVRINRPAGDRETQVTIAPGTAETTLSLPGNKRFNITKDARGFVFDLLGAVYFPGI